MRGINRQLCDIESWLVDWYRAPPARGAPVHRYFRHSARPPAPAQLVPDRYARDIAPGRRSRRLSPLRPTAPPRLAPIR